MNDTKQIIRECERCNSRNEFSIHVNEIANYYTCIVYCSNCNREVFREEGNLDG